MGLAYHKLIADLNFHRSELLCATDYQGITGKLQLCLGKVFSGERISL
jgi:hypothetical protein